MPDSPKSFAFDGVVDASSSSSNVALDLVWRQVGSKISQDIAQGWCRAGLGACSHRSFGLTPSRVVATAAYNVTLFTHGAQGSGKSEVLFGSGLAEGVIGRVIRHMLLDVDKRFTKHGGKRDTIFLSAAQVYKEAAYDLLGDPDKRLRSPKEDTTGTGLYVDQKAREITSMADAQSALRFVQTILRRASPAERSAQGHTIVAAHLTRYGVTSDGTTVEDYACDVEFVRLADSDVAKGDKSLRTLDKCITALGDNAMRRTPKTGKAAPPFRKSQLTTTLRHALGGDTKLYMLAHVSSATPVDHTKRVLQFAERARLVPVHAVVGMSKSLEMLQQLRREAGLLQQQLQAQRGPEAVANAMRKAELVESRDMLSCQLRVTPPLHDTAAGSYPVAVTGRGVVKARSLRGGESITVPSPAHDRHSHRVCVSLCLSMSLCVCVCVIV